MRCFLILRNMVIKVTKDQVIIATLLLQFVVVSSCPLNCSCDTERTNCSSNLLTAVPASVDSNTRVINISFNSISTLKNKDFVNLTHLETVLLNDNDVSRLEPYVFHRTKRLLHLNLNNNNIVEINLNLLQSLKQLRYLYLQNNIIQYIHPKLFVHNANLVMLDVSGNRIHKFEPKTFQNNPILSWVNVKGNPLTLPLEWKTLFDGTLNVLDIQFCDFPNSSISAFQNVPSVNLIGTKYTTVLNLGEFMSFQNTFELDLNEIAYLRMKQFYGLNRYSFESVNTMAIGDDLNVMSINGDDILCYCRHHEFWFWCAEQPQTPCQNNVTKSEKYKILGCSTDTSTQKQAKENITSDKDKRAGLFGSYRRRHINWKTIRNTLMYAAVPLCIILLVIGAYIFKRVRSARKESSTLPFYSEVNT